MRTVHTAALGGFGALLVRGLTGARAARRPGESRTPADALPALRTRHGYGPRLMRTGSGRTVLVLLDPGDLTLFHAGPPGVLAAEPPPEYRAPYATDPAATGCDHGRPRPERRRIDTEALAPGVPVHPSYEPFLAASPSRHGT
ncbi:hypothetical protein [Streptomyces sp. NPDC058674]|uniref:hypothetical protein n=1 Tax=Streptomyces sp. NPDC058674 TaxID=3346592 RepID=UPI003666625F